VHHAPLFEPAAFRCDYDLFQGRARIGEHVSVEKI
jgi:hypothetical protein